MAKVETSRHQLRKRKHVDYCEVADDIMPEGDEGDFMVPYKKSKTKPSRPEKAFPFLLLPPEIRNRIYDLTLGGGRDEEWLVSKWRRHRRTVRCADADERVKNFGSWHRYDYYSYDNVHNDEYVDSNEEADGESQQVQRAPNLVAVCRQIFEEAGPIMYPKTFVFEDTTALHHFLSAIGPCKRAFVEKIVIKGWNLGRAHKAYNHPALSLLVGLPDIKEVEFDFDMFHHGGEIPAQRMRACAREIFRDAFRWLEAMDGAVRKVKLSGRSLRNEIQREMEPVFYEELGHLVQTARSAYSSQLFE